MTGQKTTYEDGYVTVIDAARGFGLVCEPVTKPLSWHVISFFVRIDRLKTGETQTFDVVYGTN